MAFFNSMLDMLDMVFSKADPEISKIYDMLDMTKNLRESRKKLRFQKFIKKIK